DFYVWSDTPEKYRDARVIFQDFEPSNWSWDREAQAYYWHRFYSHQPDLNYDNPEVRRTMFGVIDFWLEMGVDGLRLDAVPYLFTIIDILEQTPHIPEACQWALFLRNHDELTLEMVTDEERDYMYRVYATDPQARLNLGIRRRLAPLLGNDRKVIEMMNGLLFSMPGTPVIYYGDELGMGDNIYLGDRNGVRTPMQWSADRNAGFSSANPQKLYLPAIID